MGSHDEKFDMKSDDNIVSESLAGSRYRNPFT